MLLKRTVFEQMIAAYPGTRTHTILSAEKGKIWTVFALFDLLIIDEKYFPEDYAFCYRWRALGGKIWLDTEGKIDPSGCINLEGRA